MLVCTSKWAKLDWGFGKMTPNTSFDVIVNPSGSQFASIVPLTIHVGPAVRASPVRWRLMEKIPLFRKNAVTSDLCQDPPFDATEIAVLWWTLLIPTLLVAIDDSMSDQCTMT
jgi:hypothetical protein